jgi:hypothetical protein
VNLAVEVTRVVPASGNLNLRGQQFWLGPVHAGRQLTVWADTTAAPSTSKYSTTSPTVIRIKPSLRRTGAPAPAGAPA